jgi:preprotein translocase subunit SecG
VLIGWLIAVVVVLGVIAAVLLTRRSHDDVHSVEHYHRQLHTLEEIRGHTGDAANGNDSKADKAFKVEGEAFPASAFRVSGSSTVRLTGSDQAPVPPVPPPSVPNPSKPLTFDDASPDPVPATFMTGNEDRVIRSIDHRPRRLGGPAAAVAAVLVLVLVLILTGLHSNTGKHHGKSAAATTATTHPATSQRHHETTTTTSTTAPPSVSAPSAATSHTASYTVSDASYSLNIAATTGECWVDVTNTTTGAVLFTTTLQSGQSHTIAASGPVTVIAGAPGEFAATVDGAAVTLPTGNQAPFTLHFLPASAVGGSGTAAPSSTTPTT